MARVFANGPGDQGSIPGRVIPKTQKWYLMPSCLTLTIIRYGSRVKWVSPRKGLVLYCHLHHHNDTIIKTDTMNNRRNDKRHRKEDARRNKRRRKTSLTNIYLSLYCKDSKGLFKDCM